MSFLIPAAYADAAALPPALPVPVLNGSSRFSGHLLSDDLAPTGQACQGAEEPAEQLAKGDEVVTNGGIAGKIVKVSDDFVVLEVSDNVELKFQKGAVAATLPKGTLKAI